MSATEIWARAKASGMAENLHPETAKNMGIDQPQPPVQTKPEPEIVPPPDYRPRVEKNEPPIITWDRAFQVIYLGLLAYCIYAFVLQTVQLSWNH